MGRTVRFLGRFCCVMLCSASSVIALPCDVAVEDLWFWVAELEGAEETLAACRQQAARRQDAGDRALMELAYAVLRLQQGRPGAAFDHAQAALEVPGSGFSHPALFRARCLQLRGDSLFFLGRPAAAAEDFSAALRLAGSSRSVPQAELGALPQDPLAAERFAAFLHKDLGIALRELGRYEESLEHLNRARSLALRYQTSDLLGSVLGNLGSVYRRLGADRLAVSAYGELYDSALAAGDDTLALDALARLGDVYLEAGSPQRAVEELEQARAVAESSGTQAEQIWILEMLADALMESGEAAASCEIFEKTVRHHRRTAPAYRLLASLVGLGTCLESRSPERAAKAYFEAEAVAAGSEPAASSWAALAGLGRLAIGAEDPDRAVELFELALAAAELERDEESGPADRQLFAQRMRPIYDSLVEALWRRSAAGDLRRAFEASEASRAHGRAERWWRGREQTRPPDPQLARLELELTEVSRALRRSDGSGSNGSASIDASRAALEQRGAELEVALRAREEALFSALDIPLTVPALEHLQRVMAPETRLLIFHLTPHHVFVFLLDSNDLELFEIELEREELKLAVENLLELVQRDGESWRPASRRLYRQLIEPWWTPSAGSDLIVVAESPLHQLPMEILLAPSTVDGLSERLWMEDLAISYALSATTAFEQWITASRSTSDAAARMLLIAQPVTDHGPSAARQRSISLYEQEGLSLEALPSSRREVESAGRFSVRPPRVLLGADATERGVREALAAPFEVVHFATHAVLSHRRPSRSALILTPSAQDDGLLQAREILRTQIRAELVVLSACQTARQVESGHVAHLADAFFLAGARSVIGSLWPVDDAETAEFMSVFYRHLAAGEAKSEALRNAKLERSKLTSPRHYAPFVLIGDPQRGVSLRRPRSWWSNWTVLAVLFVVFGLTRLSLKPTR